jgi:hypothetical protein
MEGRACTPGPPQGKGITDQDRNILSNQILILGFLRSAARYLVRGPTPQLQPSRKRKRPSSDDEWTDGDDEETIDGRARGTILITLRNVPPYTEWSAYRYTASGGLANITFAQGRAKTSEESTTSTSLFCRHAEPSLYLISLICFQS